MFDDEYEFYKKILAERWEREIEAKQELRFLRELDHVINVTEREYWLGMSVFERLTCRSVWEPVPGQKNTGERDMASKEAA